MKKKAQIAVSATGLALMVISLLILNAGTEAFGIFEHLNIILYIISVSFLCISAFSALSRQKLRCIISGGCFFGTVLSVFVFIPIAFLFFNTGNSLKGMDVLRFGVLLFYYCLPLAVITGIIFAVMTFREEKKDESNKVL